MSTKQFGNDAHWQNRQVRHRSLGPLIFALVFAFPAWNCRTIVDYPQRTYPDTLRYQYSVGEFRLYHSGQLDSISQFDSRTDSGYLPYAPGIVILTSDTSALREGSRYHLDYLRYKVRRNADTLHFEYQGYIENGQFTADSTPSEEPLYFIDTQGGLKLRAHHITLPLLSHTGYGDIEASVMSSVLRGDTAETWVVDNYYE